MEGSRACPQQALAAISVRQIPAKTMVADLHFLQDRVHYVPSRGF
jgi:hypothetical protein